MTPAAHRHADLSGQGQRLIHALHPTEHNATTPWDASTQPTYSGALSKAPRLDETRIETDPETVGRDLGRLVLTLVELIRQLMERQALRRIDGGDLPEDTVERLGLGLMRLEEAMTELRTHFGLRPEDLNIDLGPLGPLLAE